MLDKIAKISGGRNLIAPILGYDTIETGKGNGVELVMNRGAVIALDETLKAAEALEWLDKGHEITRQDKKG
jgi:hypothetical protein